MADETTDFLARTTQIVSAHVGHNSTTPEALLALIKSVHAALANVNTVPAEVPRSESVVPIKRSVFPDYIICLEDGKKLKMLKRHLRTAYGMTPDQYRTKWDLPANYPLVAPNYAAKRSVLAKSIGLGRKSAEIEALKPVATKGKQARKGGARKGA